MNSRALLASVMALLLGSQKLFAQEMRSPRIEPTSIVAHAESYLRAHQENNLAAQTDASTELSKALFYQQPKSNETEIGIKKLTPKAWTTQAISEYAEQLRNIGDTLIQYPEILAALGLTLQKTWEEIAFDALNRYHYSKSGTYQTREAVSSLAFGAIGLALPYSAFGLGKSAQAGKIVNGARLTLAAVATSGGGMQLWARLKGQTDFPPSPAEILAFTPRYRQDYRWEEASDFLVRSWKENGVTLACTAATGFAVSRLVTSMGGLRALAGGAQIATTATEAAAAGAGGGSGLWVSAGAVGTGALILTSIAGTTWALSKIQKRNRHEDAEKKVTQDFLGALAKTMQMKRSTTPSASQLHTSSELLESLGRLEAFHYAELLNIESNILLAKSEALAMGVSAGKPTIEALQEAALVAFKAFFENDPSAEMQADRSFFSKAKEALLSDPTHQLPYSNNQASQSLLQLRSLEALSQWKVDADQALALLNDPETPLTPDLRREMRTVVESYQNSTSLSYNLFREEPISFRKWIRADYQNRVLGVISRLKEHLNSELAQFELSDVSSVIFETAIWLISSPSEIERTWGSELLNRATRYIDLKKWLLQETAK